ncbi:unnamed protein product [Rotaria socialis]|uniref:MULE transposase domain-containing protein n=1 Tax=Rotaria socialis TaxID=392032 RepID=A0A821FGT7_9BILA|nr:unnamed protein product [Rotaria socialis]CAF4653167.1 unnamed protein product [Rotaria socialis]
MNGTTKQKPCRNFKGYSYIKDRSTDTKTYWRCVNYLRDLCHSRLHTCIITNDVIKPPSEHTCKTDGPSLEIRKFNEELVHRARNTQEIPDIIVTNFYKALSDQGIARLPIRDNIKRRIRMVRKNKNIVNAPNDPNFTTIPTSLTKTVRDDMFLRCDTGPGDDRILIFASTEQLDILQSTDDFLVDGTFKVVPEIFYQVYIIHAVYRGHVVPVLYALLRRKNAATYENLVHEILRFAPNWNPVSIMLDFEQACIGAFDRSFPNVLLSGCYFHLRQSIHRKLQALGHQNKYENDPEFSHNIHKIAALAFIKPDDVVKAFEDLSINLDDEYQTILDYFEETYIGRLRANHTRRKATFTIDFWSMFHRTTQSLMRTNNSAEAYHRRINAIFQCSHPTLWVFLQKLIDEQNATHADIVHIRSGQVPKSKNKNERFEKRLLHLISNPHQNILTQLDSIANNITL